MSSGEVTETILGAPLMPPAIEAVPEVDNDIRAYATRVARRAAQSILGQSLDTCESEAVRQLDEETLERIRLQPGVKEAAIRVQIANDMAMSAYQPPALPASAEAPHTPRSIFQGKAWRDIVAHSQRAPSQSATSSNPYREGHLTVAPTGAGKTTLQALAVAMSGVGRPVSEIYPQARLGVGILKSKLLIEQYLDPDETFQRYMNSGNREIGVGAYYQHKRDGHGEHPLILTTPNSYEEAVKKGAIQPEHTVTYILDEAHRYSQFGSLRSFIQEGILSPVQLFTYRAEAEKLSAEKIAIALAVDYVASGRKTLVVCQAGDYCAQARYVADAINEHHRLGHFEPHPRLQWQGDKIASAIGRFDKASTADTLQQLRHNQRLVVASVETGREGFDMPDLEALIVIGPKGALWQVTQWIGRVMRPSDRSAIISEILPPTQRVGKPHASIFGAFGLSRELIVPGYYIGPDNKAATQASKKTTSQQQPRLQPQDSYTPPTALLPVLVSGVSVREATIAPADLAKEPPADYKPIDHLAPNGVPAEWLYTILSKLDNPDIRYVGSWEVDRETGEMEYVRYYSPAAHEYFAKHPVPELASTSELTTEEIAELFEVSKKFMVNLIDRLQLTPLQRLAKYNRKTRFYSLDDVAKIGREVARIPVATETDVPLTELCQKVPRDYINNFIKKQGTDITLIVKRRNPSFERLEGVQLFVQHLTAEEAERIETAYNKINQIADPALYIDYPEMATRADLSLAGLINKLTSLSPSEQPIIHSFRAAPKHRPKPYIDRQWGEAFADRLKPQKLLPWQISLPMIAIYFGKKKMNMRKILDRRYPSPEKIPLKGSSPVAVYPISVVTDLLTEGLKPTDGMPLLDPQRLTHNLEEAIFDPDLDKIAYAQSIQGRLIAQDRLATPEQITHLQKSWLSTAEAADKINCTPLALSLLLVSDIPSEAVLRHGNKIAIKHANVEHLSKLPFEQSLTSWVSYTKIRSLAETHGQKPTLSGLPAEHRKLRRDPSTGLLDLYISSTAASAISRNLAYHRMEDLGKYQD